MPDLANYPFLPESVSRAQRLESGGFQHFLTGRTISKDPEVLSTENTTHSKEFMNEETWKMRVLLTH